MFTEPPPKCPCTSSRPPGWFTQTHKLLWSYMGKMINEWPCEVVLKHATQSWGSYVVIKGMVRHILGGSNSGRCAASRGQVTIYGKIWFIYALRFGGVKEKMKSLCRCNLWKPNGYGCSYFPNLVNETYNWNNIYSPFSVCSVMTPSFCNYPSPSIANSPSTNDYVKGENETGSFQFFLSFVLNFSNTFWHFEFIYEIIEFSPALAY